MTYKNSLKNKASLLLAGAAFLAFLVAAKETDHLLVVKMISCDASQPVKSAFLLSSAAIDYFSSGMHTDEMRGHREKRESDRE